MLSCTKSLDDEVAARLELLRDPKRMTALLMRVFSSSMLRDDLDEDAARRASTGREEEEDNEVTEETQEEEVQERKRRVSAGTTSENVRLRVVIDPVTEDVDSDGDDDDDAEEEEEEEDDEENTSKPLDEEELDVVVTTLQAATRIAEDLRLRRLLKARQEMDQPQQDDTFCNDRSLSFSIGKTLPRLSRSESRSSTAGVPGRPMPRARVQCNSACTGCGKSFYPFHRSKNCAACGFAFCPKCSSKNVVLPSCFEYRDESVRACDLCARWLQTAMDHYFDVMEMTSSCNQGITVLDGSGLDEGASEENLRAASGFSSSSVPASGLRDGAFSSLTRPRSSISSSKVSVTDCSDDVTNEIRDSDEIEAASSTTTSMSRRRHRQLAMTSATTPSVNKNKPWFSGHLRAIHVNDRLPRKKKARGESEGDAEGNTLDRRSTRKGRTSSSGSAPMKRRHTNEEIDDESGVQYDEGEKRICSNTESATSGEPNLNVLPVQNANGLESDVLARPGRKARRSKFLRSASFDLTNLLTTLSPDSLSSPLEMKHCHASGPGEIGIDTIEGNSGSANSARSKKAFDDSDIVDARAQLDSPEVKMKSEAQLAAAVLRFAVYEMGGKEGTGLRRTFGSTKANPVLDRYTLELDCRQRVVRVKSVFMHRFWSFHCDSVRSFVFGSSEGMARLITSNSGQGSQSLELKFANDDEREQFKQAIGSCRSANLYRMRGLASRAAVSISVQSELSTSSVPETFRFPMLQEPNTFFSRDSSTSVESELALIHDTGGSNAIECSIPQSICVPLLPGEVVVKDSELQATLLIGPVSDTCEPTLVWGRLRGKVAVTNYRVIFLPFDRVDVQPRCGGQGGIAYIPLFAITHVQLLYPGGRRTKSGRINYVGTAGSASIILISCKDIRVMRFQLDTVSSGSDDYALKLHMTISKLVDASQRYSVVDRCSPTNTASLVSLALPSFIDDAGQGPERGPDGEEAVLHMNKESTFYSTPGGSRNPAYAASPVLRPGRILMPPREVSGSFAFTYSIGDVPMDQDGWNVFVDEREFKRQIGGDPAVSPFLKYYKNDKGNVCKSYPSKLLLPASMNSTTLAKVADFRAKNRLPVITYYHRQNKCVLTRSSQPLLGNLLSGTSNVSDQLLLGVYRRLPDIIENQSQSSVSSRPIYIFDARKPKASTGNRLMGKGGVETSQDYPGAVIHHLNIANMYRMQSSLMGLMKLFLPGGTGDTDRTWLSSVESTRWLDHVRLVLDGALKIARVLELEGASALVHCSDGWDRTSQLCALAQLMIDPYYRTIRGIMCLIEKDWCAFGHKFCERTGGDRNRDPQRNKSSPIMFQFIDAVWQMQRQFPLSFEFNEHFLIHLANAMTSGLYGTFLYDTRLQRDVNEVKNNTVSVWTPVLMKPSLYANSNYEMYDGPIWPWVSCKTIQLWENYFFQWHPKYYRCRWACSLVHHGPSRSDCDATSRAGICGNSEEIVQQHDTLLRETPDVHDPPALDLLATPTNSAVAEEGNDHGGSSSEERSMDYLKRDRTASETYTQKASKRNLFGLGGLGRQRAQSEENGSQAIC